MTVTTVTKAQTKVATDLAVSAESVTLLTDLRTKNGAMVAAALADASVARATAERLALLVKETTAVEAEAGESRTLAGAYVHHTLVGTKAATNKDAAAILGVSEGRMSQYGYSARWLYVVGGDVANPLHRKIADAVSKSTLVRDAVKAKDAKIADVEAAYSLSLLTAAERKAKLAEAKASANVGGSAESATTAGTAVAGSTGGAKDSATEVELPRSIPACLTLADAIVAKIAAAGPLPASEWVHLYDIHAAIDALLDGDPTAKAAGMARLAARKPEDNPDASATPATVAKRTRSASKRSAVKASTEQAASVEA